MKKSDFFKNWQPEIVVVLGGDIPQDDAIREFVKKSAYCIGADSGADALHVWGRIPDLMVGDMDSVSEAALQWCRGFNVEQKLYEPEKDYTDGEIAFGLAADYAQEHGIKRIYVVGAYGSRLDHSMANIFIGKQVVDRGIEIIYLNDSCFVYFLKGKTRFEVELLNGRTISLLPFDGDASGITLRGFKYPLEDGKMTAARAYGVSNELTDDVGSIILEKGCLIVVQNREDV